MITRKEFLTTLAAGAAVSAARPSAAADDPRAAFQREIDRVQAEDFFVHERRGLDYPPAELEAACARLSALRRYEEAFDRVVRDIDATTVTGAPAVWLVYNMGVIVKTARSLFSIDLRHRRGETLARRLDFALITHNHRDHYTPGFLEAMDRREKKTVVSNFCDNYGAHFGKKHPGGYTRAVKTFTFGDVTVRTSYTDHNNYLLDFTTAFEVTVGGFTIFHSGDCSNAGKLKPVCANPDLWIFHPYCGMKPVDGARAVNPKRAVVAHLNELGHARWRWTWAQGEEAKRQLEAAGFAATVPLWGDRIC